MEFGEFPVVDVGGITALNVCLIFLFRYLAGKVDLVDYPGGRKSHILPTPLVGGLTIYLTLVVSLLIFNDWASDFAKIILWAGLVFFIGLIDDLKQIPWFVRLAVQLFATLGVVFSTNIQITYLGAFPLLGELQLGSIGLVLTVFAVVGISNAFNLIDGINGLCGGLLLIPTIVLLAMHWGNPLDLEVYLIVMAASLSIFLIFNLTNHPKCNMFMGDAGSAGLGFIVSFLIISEFQSPGNASAPPLALWLLLVPITDTVHVIAQRASKKQSIFQAGSDHLHHRLMRAGYSQTSTFLLLGAVATIGVFVGIALNSANDATSLVMFLAAVVVLPMLLTAEEKRHHFK